MMDEIDISSIPDPRSTAVVGQPKEAEISKRAALVVAEGGVQRVLGHVWGTSP